MTIGYVGVKYEIGIPGQLEPKGKVIQPLLSKLHLEDLHMRTNHPEHQVAAGK